MLSITHEVDDALRYTIVLPDEKYADGVRAIIQCLSTPPHVKRRGPAEPEPEPEPEPEQGQETSDARRTEGGDDEEVGADGAIARDVAMWNYWSA